MSKEPDHSLNKLLKNNRPKGIVALNLVEGTQSGLVQYYVRYPVKMGPQPLLGVGGEWQTHTLFGKESCTPKAFWRAAAEGIVSRDIPIDVSEVDSIFSDALTVLPQSEAERTMETRNSVTIDPVLLSAFSVVAAHYETQVAALAKDTAFMSRIPALVEEPPYKLAIVRRMQALAKQMLDEQDEETANSIGNRLAQIVLGHLTRWRLWNHVLNGATTNNRWNKHWKILKAWNRWQAFDMGWRDRAKELADDTRFSVEQDEYVNEGEKLQIFCLRMGLYAKR